MNEDGIALWKPKDSDVAQMITFKDFIDDLPTKAETHDEIGHPLLHVSKVYIPIGCHRSTRALPPSFSPSLPPPLPLHLSPFLPLNTEQTDPPSRQTHSLGPSRK
jgi:hypothetical protein